MGIDQKYVDDGYVDSGYFSVDWRGDASPSVAASMTVVGTIQFPILLGSATLSSTSSISAIAAATKVSSATLPGVAATTTVAGRRTTETVLLANTGTISASGHKVARSAVDLLQSASETTSAAVIRRAYFGIGLGANLPADIGAAYVASGILPATLDLTCTGTLNELFLDDYKYIVPAETREYTIPAETREYTIKD